MTLITKPPAPTLELGGWMADPVYTDVQRRIVRRALRDSQHTETPLGSNRSPYLDALCAWAGSPVGSYWCGIWAGAVYVDAGCRVPNLFPSCDQWLPWLIDPETIPIAERVGCAILYGKPGTAPVGPDVGAMLASGWDAKHIGIVTQWVRDPWELVTTTEGNRGYFGLAVGTPNNGVAVDTAPQIRKDVLGLVPWSKLVPE